MVRKTENTAANTVNLCRIRLRKPSAKRNNARSSISFSAKDLVEFP